ncbi:kelch repeat-containing protein [Sorangium sp. So ce1014]|uniref:Kelch repeat-containing protein n=1 Tax=Sorangium sp. So ce1014 TaxID=3133326 RepID=UPI003F6450D6
MPAPCWRSRRVAQLPSLLAAALLPGGCGAEPEDTSAAALRLRFPDHADAVLSTREAFVPTVDGFRLAAAEQGGPWLRAARPEIELPREGSGAIRFRRPNGSEIRVRELGAEGEGRMVERAVSYRRAFGTSFWAPTDGGVEEWLLLEEGVARGGDVVAAWQVEGAALRARGEAVELVDEERGVAILRVTAPRAYAASGRPVAAALRARGARIELSVDAGGEAALVDPAWEPAGRMNAIRDAASATLLLDGKVLVAGGYDYTGASSPDTAELYDPADDTWTPTTSMHAPRYGHVAVMLTDGQVLVVGGTTGDPALGSIHGAERYDPETERWTPTEPVITARKGFTATLLAGGKVLVTGGYTGSHPDLSYLDTAELYDRRFDVWHSAARMGAPRAAHAALLLPSGKVLVTGGYDGSTYLDDVELYDPATDTWAAMGTMRRTRSQHTMTPLLSGEVLVANGQSTDANGLDAELHDPAANTWTLTGRMHRVRGGHSATRLPSGHVLLAGGITLEAWTSAELYDPGTGEWTLTAPMSSVREAPTATLLPNGQVLVAGGNSTDAERFVSLGVACTEELGCGSAFCVEGFCCDSPCTEPCHTCARSSSLGRCVPQPRGSDLRMDCSRTGCSGACDGFGACSAVPVDSVCLPAVCVDETHSAAEARCPADGVACPSPAEQERETRDCAPYRCDRVGGACKEECSSLQDCAPGFACDFSNRCAPAPLAPNRGCHMAQPAASVATRSGLGALLLALLAMRKRRSSPLPGAPMRAPEAS